MFFMIHSLWLRPLYIEGYQYVISSTIKLVEVYINLKFDIMNIKEINFANIDLVEIRNGTPHCIKHGAMNKITKNEDSGGYWRCITVVSNTVDTVCRAGCNQIKL